MTRQHEQPTSPADDFEWVNAWAASANPAAPAQPTDSWRKHPGTVVAMRDFTIVATGERDLPDVDEEPSGGKRLGLFASDLAAIAAALDMLDIAQAQVELQAQPAPPSSGVDARRAAALQSPHKRSDRALFSAWL